MMKNIMQSSAMANFNKTPHLAVILTNQCNLNCDYCLRGKNTQNIPLDKLKKIIKEAQTEGYCSIGLTGGEILLYPQLKELLRFLNEMKWNVLFETNGVLLDDEWVEFIARLFSKDKICFSVSLDSHKSLVHDSLRGQGSFDKAVAAIKLLKKASFEVRTIAILSGKNMLNAEDISRYLNFCDQLDANFVSFQEIVPIGKNGIKYLNKDENKDFCFEAIGQFKGRMAVSGPRKNNSQSIFDCDRLERGNLCLSAAGIHPCIFSEEIIIGSLDDFSTVRIKQLRAYSEFRKYALLIQNKQDSKKCSGCLSMVKSAIKDLNKKNLH